MTKVYIIRNKKILEGVIVRENGRGTSKWIQLKSGKHVWVSKFKIFNTHEAAKKEIIKMRKLKKKLEHELEIEDKKIGLILDKIYTEFGVEILYLSKPVSEQDTKKLYQDIKSDKSCRNKKIFI
ncbi:hypothetical protein NNC19_18030 [Clostridium sp. SHJSY1]|uniref:hypothetical protein n=1 Tax=Clostridium sp. SHJSY1 TaxID=2942483 RepID=UPI0028767C8D|nr:hypothetical protein [Clostridium sp. SHJSY1]MDS0527592.1 hypothetical protein [Clostridium sp. SHJSY1]